MMNQHNKNPHIFYLAVAQIIVPHEWVLLVRKKGTRKFMFPGGKIDPNETPQDALIRELEEETTLITSSLTFQFIKEYETIAANEPNWRIKAHLYRTSLSQKSLIYPKAEIAEVKWFHYQELSQPIIAPLVKESLYF